MCFFHYSICDDCRYPSTTHATLARECLGFLEQLKHSRDTKPFESAPRDALAMLHEEGTLEGGSAWQSQGSSTVAQQVLRHEEKSFDLSWDIRPQRKCVRWVPEPVVWVCGHCRTAEEQATEGETATEHERNLPPEVFELAPETAEAFEPAAETASEQTEEFPPLDSANSLNENGDGKHEAVRTAWRKVGRKLLGRSLSASNGEAPNVEAPTGGLPNGNVPPHTP